MASRSTSLLNIQQYITSYPALLHPDSGLAPHIINVVNVETEIGGLLMADRR
jgi:hypothetical protein